VGYGAWIGQASGLNDNIIETFFPVDEIVETFDEVSPYAAT
jgi:hypothetical protein